MGKKIEFENVKRNVLSTLILDFDTDIIIQSYGSKFDLKK